MIIKTKQFILRPFKLTDAQDIARNINDWDIIKCLAMQIFPYKLKDAKNFLSKTLPNYKLRKPRNFVLAIEIDGEVAGAIGIHKVTFGHDGEIGYWLAKKHWGKGVMTKVVKAFCDSISKKFKLQRLQAKVFKFNQGSKIVLENNGFKLEGILKKGALKNGKFIDEYLFAKVK